MAEIIQNPYASRTAHWRIYLQEGRHAGNYLVATNKETYAKWLLSHKENILRRRGAKWFMTIDGQEQEMQPYSRFGWLR